MTYAERWAKLPRWVRSALTLADLYLNARLRGVVGETISERFGHARDAGDRTGIAACKLLDRYDAGHCDRAVKYGHLSKDF